VELTREEKLKLLEGALVIVQAGLLEPTALDGFKLAKSPKEDPIAAISGVFDGIANLYRSKLALPPGQ
jgi:hypothetical protein